MSPRGEGAVQGAGTTSEPGTGYRPHLDGMRAIAVYLVVAYHAGADRLANGFIGVDVFFVLSGYLVTQILVRDVATVGRARLTNFYARRMRRLLPASLIVLVITAVVYSALATPAAVSSVVGSFQAALLYVANWHFIRHSTDYFASTSTLNPVLHFWSLAVEEQFYLLWPLGFTGLVLLSRRFGARAHRVRQAAVAAGLLASMLWALHLAGPNLDRAYYGTDARAYQLLAGALIALSPGILRRAGLRRLGQVAAVAAVAALLLLATDLVDVGPISRGIAVMVVTVVLIVAMERIRTGPVVRVLSWQPVVYLGRISYGTYLWHWPIIVFTLLITNRRISPVSTFAISALLATALASLSYTLIEQPIRLPSIRPRLNPVVIAVGLTAGIVAAVTIVPNILTPSRARNLSESASASSSGAAIPQLDFDTARLAVPEDVRGVRFLPSWGCRDEAPTKCTIVPGGRPHILVIGDSEAQTTFGMFAGMALRDRMTLSTYASPGCPWQRNLFFDAPDAFHRRWTAQCKAVKRDLYDRVLPALRPDVIVATSLDYLSDRTHLATLHNASDHPVAPGRGGVRAQFVRETRHSLDLLTRYGAKVVMVEPLPVTTQSHDPFQCLLHANDADRCRFTADPGIPDVVNQVYRAAADDRTVFSIDLDRAACPSLPTCDAVSGGQVTRFDYEHMTPRFAAATLGPTVTRWFVQHGLLPA